MKVMVFTSNQLRHKYLANKICESYPESLVICETQSYQTGHKKTQKIEMGEFVFEHFQNIQKSEQKLFKEHQTFKGGEIFPLPLGEVNSSIIEKLILEFQPDMAIVFGASWIKESIIKLLPQRKIINIHMGISPYYRGHSTNFWAYYLGEPHLAGASLLELSPELDKGNIIAQIPTSYEDYDNYYDATLGLVKSVWEHIETILENERQGVSFLAQDYPDKIEGKYFESKDFTDKVAQDFLKRHMTLYPRKQRENSSFIKLRFSS